MNNRFVEKELSIFFITIIDKILKYFEKEDFTFDDDFVIL